MEVKRHTNGVSHHGHAQLWWVSTYYFSKGVVPEDCELSLWLLVAVDDNHSGQRHDLDRHTQLAP